MITMLWKRSNVVEPPRCSISRLAKLTTGPDKGRRWILRVGFVCLCWTVVSPRIALAQLLSGYSLAHKHLDGPAQMQTATDPIWVVDYPSLSCCTAVRGRSQ